MRIARQKLSLWDKLWESPPPQVSITWTQANPVSEKNPIAEAAFKIHFSDMSQTEVELAASFIDQVLFNACSKISETLKKTKRPKLLFCRRCGEGFYGRPDAKWCGGSCKMAAHRERRLTPPPVA